MARGPRKPPAEGARATCGRSPGPRMTTRKAPANRDHPPWVFMKISSQPPRVRGWLFPCSKLRAPDTPSPLFWLLSVENLRGIREPHGWMSYTPRSKQTHGGSSNPVTVFVSLPENSLFLSFRGCWILCTDIENVTYVPSSILLSVLWGQIHILEIAGRTAQQGSW